MSIISVSRVCTIVPVVKQTQAVVVDILTGGVTEIFPVVVTTKLVEYDIITIDNTPVMLLGK